MPNPILETYKHKATGTIYDLADADARSAIQGINALIPADASTSDMLVKASELTAGLATKVNTSSVGSANGVAELDANGKVPSAQLPSYVDDVLEYASQSAFPATGETGKIYIALDTNKTYRWSGSAYVEISESLALGETSSTAYAGNKGKANADAITAMKDGTNIDSFGDVETALALKQNKTLDTALTIRGQQKTTVEAALGGLLSWLNDLGLSVVDGALCVTYEE